MKNPLFVVTSEESEKFRKKHSVQFWLGWVLIVGATFVSFSSMHIYKFGIETGIVFLCSGFSMVLYDRHIANVLIKDIKKYENMSD